MSFASDGPAMRAPGISSGAAVLRVLENGFLCGALGALVVAVWFLILDVIQGRPFFTPSLLGSVVFSGASAERVDSVSVVMVFAYSGLHGMLFVAWGTAIALLFSQLEKRPAVGVFLVVLFVLSEAVIFGLEVTIVPRLVGSLGAVQVGVANLLAAAVMFWFLLLRHPGVIDRLKRAWSEG